MKKHLSINKSMINRISILSCIARATTLLACLAMVATLDAEEIIIEEGRTGPGFSIGDYFCSPCFAKTGKGSLSFGGLTNPDSQAIEMTAGELWRFFDEQGFKSVSQMTLFLELNQLSSDSQFDLSELNVQIQHPDGLQLLTNLNLGADQLIVPGYETSSTRPEAELRFDLGYDFMQEFTPESTELVRLNVASSSASTTAAAPRFLISADSASFSQSNLSSIFGFIFFWGMVFLVLLRWMKPARPEISVASGKSNGKSKPVTRRGAMQRTA